jgi:hypothetical protein
VNITNPANLDLATRRRRVGVSIEAIAAGLGLKPAEIREIEGGTASDALRDHYIAWLDRIEAWQEDKRFERLLAAVDHGRLFAL